MWSLIYLSSKCFVDQIGTIIFLNVWSNQRNFFDSYVFLNIIKSVIEDEWFHNKIQEIDVIQVVK